MTQKAIKLDCWSVSMSFLLTVIAFVRNLIYFFDTQRFKSLLRLIHSLFLLSASQFASTYSSDSNQRLFSFAQRYCSQPLSSPVLPLLPQHSRLPPLSTGNSHERERFFSHQWEKIKYRIHPTGRKKIFPTRGKTNSYQWDEKGGKGGTGRNGEEDGESGTKQPIPNAFASGFGFRGLDIIFKAVFGEYLS